MPSRQKSHHNTGKGLTPAGVTTYAHENLDYKPNARERLREDAIEKYTLSLACRAVRHAESIILMRDSYADVVKSLRSALRKLSDGGEISEGGLRSLMQDASDALLHGVNAKMEAARTLDLVDGADTVDGVVEMQQRGDFSLEEEEVKTFGHPRLGGSWDEAVDRGLSDGGYVKHPPKPRKDRKQSSG